MSKSKGASPTLSYRQKHEQANREAAATVAGLAITVVVWIACGFGLSGLDVTVFHTPLWVVGGTIGTWACAIVVAVVLAKRVFADFALDDGEGAEHE
ncbi:MAG: YhdT family protein [Eggerthellaceae bacterium]|nr:YhdT family protein [Eggerthellaceae bacterium]